MLPPNVYRELLASESKGDSVTESLRRKNDSVRVRPSQIDQTKPAQVAARGKIDDLFAVLGENIFDDQQMSVTLPVRQQAGPQEAGCSTRLEREPTFDVKCEWSVSVWGGRMDDL